MTTRVALAIGAAGILAACSRDADPYRAEIHEREQFARTTLTDAGGGRAFNVSSSSDVQFENGFSFITYDPVEDFRMHAFRWMGQRGHVRLRAHPGKAMRLLVAGWVNDKVIRAFPVVTGYIDGVVIGTTGAIDAREEDKRGHYFIDATIPADGLRRRWVDLILTVNAIGFHWGEPPDLRTVVVYKLEWTELP